MLVFQCIWPFGYRDPVCFQRSVMTYNWDESYINEESTPTLSELSLYTPPMTPREETLDCSTNSTVEDKFNESISSKRESTDCNKLLPELANNKFIEEKDISRHDNKHMPEIINIEKVNIDVSRFLPQKYFDDEKMQKYSYATSVVDSAVDSSSLFTNTEYSDFSSRTQSKIEKEHNTGDNVQKNEVVTCLNVNDINMLSAVTHSIENTKITNNSNIVDYSMQSTIDSSSSKSHTSLDTILDSIFDDVSNITHEMKTDWLDFI